MGRKIKRIISYILVLVCMTSVLGFGNVNCLKASAVSSEDEIISETESTENTGKPEKDTKEEKTDTEKKTSESSNETSESDNKTSESDNKTSESDNKSSESDNKTSESDNKTSESDNKTTESDKKTTESDKKTTESDKKTTESDKKTTESDKKTTESDNKTTEADKKDTSEAVSEANDMDSDSNSSDDASEGTGSSSSGNVTQTGASDKTTEEEEPTLEQLRSEYDKSKLNEEDSRIEQIQVNKPYVRAYFYYNNEKPLKDAVEVTLGENILTIEDVAMWSQKELKINYFFLIDVSGSMTTSNFKATKEEVKYFAENNMNANDTLTIYTVGDDVECVVDRKTRDDNEEIEEIVDSITGDNNATYLDDAISETADNIMKYNINFKDSLPDGRDIIVAFTDGENCSKDGKTQNDAKEKLKESGATMYGFLQDSVASGEARKNFDEMSRNSGGNSRIFTADNLNEELNSLVNELNEVYVVECKDINNKIDDEYKKLSLTIYDDTEEIAYLFNSRDVMVDKSVADNIHPEIVSVTVLSGENENKINVQFSESVLGADDISHYILSEKTEEGEKPVSIAGVKYDKNTYLTTITLYEPLYSGEYILEINDVTDNTWEENSLNGSPYEFTSNGPEYVEEEEKTEKSFFARFWWLIVIGIIILFAIVLLVIYRVIKKRKGVIVVDGKATFADNVDIKKHVIIEEEDKTGKDLSLYLNSGGKIIKKIDTKINGSIIIGRSDLCDIFIDDATMSRQHFAIEYTDGDFYVQDLDTTNGTMLNGVKLVHKRRLEKDDRITAGSLDIIVRW